MRLYDFAYPQRSISAEHTAALSDNLELQSVDATAACFRDDEMQSVGATSAGGDTIPELKKGNILHWPSKAWENGNEGYARRGCDRAKPRQS